MADPTIGTVPQSKTATYKLVKPAIYADRDTWGQALRNNFDLIDTILSQKVDGVGNSQSLFNSAATPVLARIASLEADVAKIKLILHIP